MTILAALLAAALAAPSTSTSTTSPEPALAPTTAASSPAGPAAGAQELPEPLRSLFARELPALPPRPFKTSHGVTGQVEAAAPPETKAEEGAEEVTVSLGTDAPMSCAFVAERLDGAAAVWRVVEGAKANATVITAMPVDVVEVKGSALLLAQLAYYLDGAQGRRVGLVKIAAYVHPTRSFLCTHDEPGYAGTFARIAKGLAGSLGGGGPDPRAQASFTELSVLRIGPLAVGYGEHVFTRGEGGRVVHQQIAAQLLPRGPADLMAVDTFAEEVIDGKDLLERGVYVQATNGEVESRMAVVRGKDGRTYAYEGEKDGKTLEGSFPTKAGLASELWFARRLARSAPAKGDVRHEAYSAETNPVAAIPVVYRRAPATPRRATMELGPISMAGDLDPHGFFESAELPLGPATLVIKRLASRGTP